jgi:hypothetical protein
VLLPKQLCGHYIVVSQTYFGCCSVCCMCRFPKDHVQAHRLEGIRRGCSSGEYCSSIFHVETLQCYASTCSQLNGVADTVSRYCCTPPPCSGDTMIPHINQAD